MKTKQQWYAEQSPASINKYKNQKSMLKIEFGAMSSKYSIECSDKLVGYAVILMQFANSPGMVAIYSPEECKNDSWMNFEGKTEELIQPLYSEHGGFESFLKAHIEQIKECRKTIKQIV